MSWQSYAKSKDLISSENENDAKRLASGSFFFLLKALKTYWKFLIFFSQKIEII